MTLGVVLVSGLPAAADLRKCLGASDTGSVPSAFFEDDVLWLSGRRGDKYYTTGVRIAQAFPRAQSSDPPSHIWPFRKLADDDYCFSQGGAVGLNLYTPENTKVSTIIPDDRPYGAWLYVAYVLTAFQVLRPPRAASPAGEEATNAQPRWFGKLRQARVLELDLGVVGPAAAGKWFQNTTHRIINKELSRGWHNQIKNEPGFAAQYQRFIRLQPTPDLNRWGWDATTHFGGSLGNVFTNANLGGTLRFGYNITDDIGPAPRPQVLMTASLAPDEFTQHAAGSAASSTASRKWFELHAFVRGEPRLVLRNEFLQGTLLRKSPHSVRKRPFVADVEAGAVVRIRWIQVTWRTVLRSPEFKTQKRSQRFGSLNVSFLDCRF